MSTIAFIGLGIMGSPMAVNLAKAGHHVIGYNLSPKRTAPLVEAGGSAAESISAAVKDADVIAVMVPDSPDVQEVLVGEGGVFDNARDDALIIDFSSIRPDVSAALAKEAKPRGFRIIDAPVSGGEAGAINASLSIMVGGDVADFDSAKPILDAVGRTVVHVGSNGSGQTVKAANQLIVAGNIQLLAEAVIFLEAYRVDMDAALKVLGGGLAGSAVLNQKAQMMLDRQFNPGFELTCTTRISDCYQRIARSWSCHAARRGPCSADGIGARERRWRPRPLSTAAGWSGCPAAARAKSHNRLRKQNDHATHAYRRCSRADTRDRGRDTGIRSARSCDQPILFGNASACWYQPRAGTPR